MLHFGFSGRLTTKAGVETNAWAITQRRNERYGSVYIRLSGELEIAGSAFQKATREAGFGKLV